MRKEAKAPLSEMIIERDTPCGVAGKDEAAVGALVEDTEAIGAEKMRKKSKSVGKIGQKDV